MRNQSPELSNIVLDSLTESIAMLDAQGVIIGVNEAWRRFAADNRGECTQHYIGQNYLATCERAFREDGDELAGAMCVGLRAVLRGDMATYTLEYPCHSPEAQRWFIAHITRCGVGDTPGLVVSHEDISARKLAELALEQAERTLRMILEALPVGVWLTDASGRVVQGNAAGLRIWGGPAPGGSRVAPAAEIRRVQGGQVLSVDEWAAASALRTGAPTGEEELEVRTPEGERRVLLHATVPLRDAAGKLTGAIIVDQDISARYAAEERVREAKREVEQTNRELQEALQRESRAARRDDLTGAANRRHFFAVGAQIVESARRYRRPLAIIMFDLDHFKGVNDRYGHPTGDLSLRHVTRLAQQHLRGSDVLARYGGEEFVILLPETDSLRAQEVANRIRRAVETQALDTALGSVALSISAGIAELDAAKGDTLEGMIGHADAALYAAKASGRNRCLIYCGPATLQSHRA